MTIEQTLLDYQRRGVEFSLNGSNLRYKAQKNILTEKDKELLREKKQFIIDYLAAHEESSVIEDIENRYAEFPLTDIQSSYLIGQESYYKYGGTSCKVYTEIEFDNLELEKVQEAWNHVVKNNDMLHAVIEKAGVQRILEMYEVPQIKYEDFSGILEDKIYEKVEEKRKRIIKTKYEAGTWPLFTLEMTKLKEKCILHFSLDMLIADFVSINIIFNEFEQFYYGEERSLTNLSFRDIVIYRENMKNTPEGKLKYEKDKEYWAQRIAVMPEPPQFPIEEHEKEDVAFTQHTFSLSVREYEILCHISREACVTPSSTILMAYAETLKTISKNREFCIDITMSDRPRIHPEIDKVVGDFTIADILEIRDCGYATYLDEVKGIQERLWDDLSHNSFSSTEVLRELGKKSKKEIAVPAVYTSTLGAMKETDKRRGKIVYTISQTPQVLIDCQILEVEGRLRINWDVRNGVFPPNMIEEAFETFRENVYKFTIEESLNKKIATELPQSVKKMRESVNNTQSDIKEQYIYNGFLHTLKEHPQNKALYSDGKTYSYEELACYAKCVQKELLEKGFLKGNITAVAVSKGVWQIASVLAILTLGGTYLPIDIHQPSERAGKILKSAKAQYCILEDMDFIKEEDKNKISICSLENKINKDYTLAVIPTAITEPAYVIFTSGSTGIPKGVVISHAAAANTILDINSRYKVTEKDRILNLANLSFDLSVYDIFGAFFAGAEIIQVSEEKRKDPAHWHELIKKQKVTIYNSVPGQMKMLTMLLEGKKEERLDSLRLILLSGDWIPVDLPGQIIKYFADAVTISLGGATEAAIWSIFHPINPKKVYKKSIPYGKPLSNQRFYILNEKLEEVPDWITGEIYIAGKGLALEYLGDKELTEKKFIYSNTLKERLYRTGDIGRYMPDGNIEFQGRADFQVKVRGHRIELGEIESAISEILNLKDLKVIAAQHNGAISICMFAVLGNGQIELRKEDMEEKLKKKLPDYMIPSIYLYLDKIPLTANGKIDVKQLNTMAAEVIEKNRKTNYEKQNLSEIEEKIYQIWCEIFETHEISVDEDFFDCGGDSILIVKLITELEQRHQYKISLEAVYAGPTVRQMAQSISN
ncbi:MAG: amino acid adenylation domain-containing protein [Muricomes sp.]